MAPKLQLAAILLLSSLAAAKQCVNITVPVDIESRQGLFTEPPFEGNLDATAFAQKFTNIGANYTKTLLKDYQTLKGSFKISAKFCHPDSGISNGPVQILVHGIGFDKSYWDLAYNNYNYSYTDVAVNKYNYNTLAIDRLGVGNSSHGDPVNQIQAQAEIAALYQITLALRNGSIPEINHSFNKVIHVGHSFGSIQSFWLSALYPTATDGLVLTGYSQNGSFLSATIADWNLHLARLNQPLRFGNASNTKLRSSLSDIDGPTFVQAVQKALGDLGVDVTNCDIWNDIATTEVGDIINGLNRTVEAQNLPGGYMTWSDFTANQYAFLLPGAYDLSLGLFGEANKQPVTAGELLTLGSGPMQTSFAGPVIIYTGNEDSIFCGGDCTATGGVGASIPAAAQKSFPSASAFEAYLQPNTAHGINFHYNSSAGNAYVQEWLGAHGLGA